MRIGIYVGSFNPVHDGHIHVAKYLIDNGYVDKVLLLPTPGYWHKQNLADVNDRVNMLKFYEEDNIIVDDIHNVHPYTYQVLDSLNDDYKDAELYLILGSDNLEKFHLWEHVDLVLKYNIIVLNRGNIDIKKYLERFPNGKFTVIDDFDYINVSSTEIRNGRRDCIKKEVASYIDENHLYS